MLLWAVWISSEARFVLVWALWISSVACVVVWAAWISSISRILFVWVLWIFIFESSAEYHCYYVFFPQYSRPYCITVQTLLLVWLLLLLTQYMTIHLKSCYFRKYTLLYRSVEWNMSVYNQAVLLLAVPVLKIQLDSERQRYLPCAQNNSGYVDGIMWRQATALATQITAPNIPCTL